MNMLRSIVSQTQRRRTIGRPSAGRTVTWRDVRPAVVTDLQPHAQLYKSVAFSDEGRDFPDDFVPVVLLNPAVRSADTAHGPAEAVFFHLRDESAAPPQYLLLRELFQPEPGRLPIRRLWVDRP